MIDGRAGENVDTQLPSEVFETAVRAHGDAVLITDAQLDEPGPTIVFANPAFVRLTGYDLGSVTGRNPRFLQGMLTDRAVLDRLRYQLSRGRRFEGETINYRADGTAFVMSWTIDPVTDSGGSPTFFVAIQRDVTERRQLERFRIASQALAGDLDALSNGVTVKQALRRANDRIHRALDSMLLVGQAVVASRVARDWVVTPNGGDGQPLDLIRRHRQPAVLRRLDGSVGLVAPFPTGSVPGGLVVDGLDASSAGLVSLDHLVEFAALASRSLMAVAVMRERRREALAVQRVLRPQDELHLPKFDTAVRYLPSNRSERAGGDWYDAVDLGDRIRLVVGDVTGKGLRAAAEMGLIRAHLNALLTSRAALSDALADADAFCRQERLMATALLVDVDRHEGTVSAVSAGHPPPFIIEAGRARMLHLDPVPPLGAFSDGSVRALESHDVLAEAVLVTYTDGVIPDRQLGAAAGMELLCKTLEGAEPTPAALVDALVSNIAETRPDDIAVMAIARVGD